MRAFDLSGSWQGHYLQSGGRHGISMRVVQRGQSFVGHMHDASTILAGRTRMQTENSGTTEVELLSTLPADSTVEGEVDGRRVTFMKSYRGKATTSVFVPDRGPMQFEFPGHQVHYIGILDDSGHVLHGHWSIPGPEGTKPQRDHFELRRIGGP
jgi:hypothetical protein